MRTRAHFYVVGATFIVIIFIALSQRYSSSSPGPCFDGIMNNDEQGIDCGGECVRVCSERVRGLDIDEVHLFSPEEGKYGALALIENPNTDIVGEEVPYVFNFYDTEDSLVFSKSGSIKRLDRPTFAVFSDTERFESTPVRAEFVLLDGAVWNREDIPRPRVQLQNRALEYSGDKTSLSVWVVNKSVTDVFDVEVLALLFEGDILKTLSQTVVSRVPTGETEEATMTWPGNVSDGITKVELRLIGYTF